jgi:hypothetical protein
MSDIQVIGVKETIKELRQLDPELRKQFNRDAKKIAQPVIDKAKNSYPTKYLSGMARAWSQRGRQLFPYSQRDAQRGVVFKINTSRSAVGILTIIQKNPAAAIVDMAGKAGGSGAQGARFITALFGQPSRVMWPAYESTEDQVQREMLDLVREASETVENRITVIR